VAEEQDLSSRTEEATPRKLEESRRKGDVAKSADLPSAMALAAACATVMAFGGPMSQSLAQSLSVFLSSPNEMTVALETGGGLVVLRRAISAGAPILLSVMFAAGVAGAAGHLVQHGVLWTTDKLKPDPSRLSPMAGFKRIYGLDGIAQFVKTLIKLAISAWVAWRALAPHWNELANVAVATPGAILPFARSVLVALFSSALAFLGLTAGLDWLWQRQRFLARMRMTREELKEDFRQSEGDPHVKARLKQIRNARARKRMIAAVPKATLVVTNPTHFAVALRYVAGETPAPICVAKGLDTLALRIREVAAEHAVPVIEDPPLARALYAAVEVDDTIPREHYEAVAKVIGFIMNARKPRPARARPL
jgi:flagellar biosynthetic protein FlhB